MRGGGHESLTSREAEKAVGGQNLPARRKVTCYQECSGTFHQLPRSSPHLPVDTRPVSSG